MNKTHTKNGVVLVLALAIAVGVIYVWPDVWFIQKAGPEYKGIAPVGFIDETLYLGRLNAIYKGDRSLRNPAIYEHRNDPVIMPPLSEHIEAGVGRLFGLGIDRLDMAATFLLPAVLFLLIALFAYQLSGSWTGSAVTGLAVLFGMHLFSRAFLLGGRLWNPAYELPLWFGRPITPQMHFIFFAAALAAAYKAIVDRRVVFTVLAGILIGLLFYVSVFYWMYLYALLAVVFITLLLNKDIASAIRTVSAGIISLVISIPYWLENLKTMSHPHYEELLLRFNIAYTQKAILPISAIAVLALIFLARRQILEQAGKKAFWFLSSMMIAIMLTLNQQIITGRLFKESHWLTYTGKFAMIVAVMVTVVLLVRSVYDKKGFYTAAARFVTAAFCLMLLVHAITVQSNYNVKNFDYNMRLQGLAGVFAWLKANTPPDAVVLPSPNDVTLSEELPVNTDNYVYYSEPFFCLSLASFDETRYRLLAAYRLFGYTQDDVARHPYSWDGGIFLTSATNRPASFVADEQKKLDREYASMRPADALRLARKYKVDYVIAVRGEDEAVIRSLAQKGYKRVYEDDRYAVIKVGG